MGLIAEGNGECLPLSPQTDAGSEKETDVASPLPIIAEDVVVIVASQLEVNKEDIPRRRIASIVEPGPLAIPIWSGPRRGSRGGSQRARIRRLCFGLLQRAVHRPSLGC